MAQKARPPLHRLKKDEILWLANNRCKAHRHTYLDHYNCYLREEPSKERIAVLDIEASSLKADAGFVLTWALKPLGGDDASVVSAVVTKAEIMRATNGDEDRRVVAALMREITKYDKILTYFGRGFDVPFLRSRAVSMGLPFPVFGTLQHIDCYFIIKSKFNLTRKSQENACRVLLGKTDKTHFSPVIWRKAARGDRAALAMVLDHNIKDIQDLEKLYLKVRDYGKRNDVSI